MATGSKRVAILSDNDSLAWVIELNLSKYLDIECTRLAPSPLAEPDSRICTAGFDLVVLAIGQLATSPAAMLAQVLPGEGRRVSLLIISNEPSRPDWNGEVYRLNFPFSAYDFHRQIKEILNSGAVTAETEEDGQMPAGITPDQEDETMTRTEKKE